MLQSPRARRLTSQVLQVGVSMVLSFMFVWDLPNIASGAASLRTSRLAPFYYELAPTFIVFGQLFGKALQAQASSALPAASVLVCSNSDLPESTGLRSRASSRACDSAAAAGLCQVLLQPGLHPVMCVLDGALPACQ